MKSFNLNEIAWDQVDSDGSKYAFLEGSKDQGRNFTYLFFLPAGMWDRPHMHTGDSRILVLKGELLAATNQSFDKNNVQHFPEGSLVHFPAGQVHYDGANVDTLVLGFGSGPWATVYCDT
jgi:quercetin dioxygenase-like cupin family protein